MGDLDAYLKIAEQRQHGVITSADGCMRRVVIHAVPLHWRWRARMLATYVLLPRESIRARRLQSASPLLLHLGSGAQRKPGWVNVDLFGDPVDLVWKLTRRLPFRDASVDGIFHEHVLEHLPLDAGVEFTRECARVLRPGATLRVGVPDIAKLIAEYVNGTDDLLAQWKPNRPTALLAVQEVFYWDRHCTMYDFETLVLLMQSAGLGSPIRTDWGSSQAFKPAPDSETRRGVTLYVETVAP
jgi:predicted SAM-dependent methyltransferase